MNLRKIIRSKLFKVVTGLCLLSSILILIADKVVSVKTKKFIYNDVQKIPKNRVGIVLGTSKKLSSGSDNLYFRYRIQAAQQLYDSGKITLFVVSGDNSREDYNEAQDMKDDLVNAGIPADSIYLDFAGFRTLDSVVRMKEIFGQSKYTIISQQFHNERAIFIAEHYGMNVIGFNAKNVSPYYGFRTMVREKLARAKVFYDLITNKQPKYLGEKVDLS